MMLVVERDPNWNYCYRVIMHHNDRYAARLYDDKPTLEEIVEFVNHCGKQLDGAEKAA
jgi:hypothetical protein